VRGPDTTEVTSSQPLIPSHYFIDTIFLTCEKESPAVIRRGLASDDIAFGGGIGQSRTCMYLLLKAHLGECSVTVQPRILKDICLTLPYNFTKFQSKLNKFKTKLDFLRKSM
jgi:hypothetical protein